MPRSDDVAEHTLDILHVVAVAGLVDTAAIAERTGLSQAGTEATLNALAADGLVSRREGRMPGWRLSDAGKQRHHDLLHADMSEPTRRRAVEELHHAFTPLNVEFKTICTDWQLRDGAANAHDDAGYDEAVTARLRRTDEALAGPLAACADDVPAIESYAPRFATALERLDSGDLDAFTRPLNHSYHDVWMELHQDLILRLQLRRGDDDA